LAADGEQILRRLERMKTARSVVETDIRDCYRYTDPARGAGFEMLGTVPADGALSAASVIHDKKADLLTDVGTEAARIHASALMSGSTPANTLWFGLDVDGAQQADKQWLEQAAHTIWTNIHASNYDAVGFDCMWDMTIAGQFVLFADEAPEGGYHFEQWPLANCYFASTKASGPVDTVFNEFSLTAEQAIAEYGENMLPEKVVEAFREKPDTSFNFVRAVYPRMGANGKFARNLPIASCHVEKDSKRVVRESGYHESPVSVPRWRILPGSQYSLGPTYDALPTLKTLNKAVEMVLANMDLAVAGMWIAEDDGVLNAKTIKIGARKVIVANSVDSMKALQPAAKFDAAFLQIERLEAQVRRNYMADQLSPATDGPVISATEAAIRDERIRQLLGPIYGRTQSEFLQWLVLRCFGIAYRAGALGAAPPSLQGKVVSVRYASPLARSQRAVEVAAMDRYEQTLGAHAAAGMTDALDGYEWDESRRLRAELMGVPLKLIKDQDAIDATRKQRQAAAQQAQAMQLASAAATSAPMQ